MLIDWSGYDKTTDTSNPQILKALTLKIASGISATEFAPNRLLNREKCATMLFNTLKAINPTADYNIAVAKGEFMPKATTAAQEAAGYGMPLDICTRGFVHL